MGRKYEDLTDRKFDRLTVIRKTENNKHNKICWLCVCDCGSGKEVIASSNNLKTGHTKSCGCLHKETLKEKRIDLKDQRYGNITVVERVEDIGSDTAWLCQCDCGNYEVFRTEYIRDKNFSGHCKECIKNKYEFKEDYVIGYDYKNIEFYFDIVDYEKIKLYSWNVGDEDYVSAEVNDEIIKLSRYILDIYDENIIVDHIDGNPRNNRRNNLRQCTKQENSFNRKVHKNSITGITGVAWHSRQNMWQARIGYNYERIHLGYYDKFEDAVLARLEAEYKYFGEYRSNRNDEYIQNILDKNKRI